jgi:hypothetical protein
MGGGGCSFPVLLSMYKRTSRVQETRGCFPRGALIQGGVIVHNDPFQKHEQRIWGMLLFWYANPTLIVQETALRHTYIQTEQKTL